MTKMKKRTIDFMRVTGGVVFGMGAFSILAVTLMIYTQTQYLRGNLQTASAAEFSLATSGESIVVPAEMAANILRLSEIEPAAGDDVMATDVNDAWTIQIEKETLTSTDDLLIQ